MHNPGYHVTFLTDESADEFVIDKYADRPDIVDTFLALTVPILKADLLRYLLLYMEGGVWFDLDVSCKGIPIDDWIPEEFRENADLVVGWEFDMGYDFDFGRQFTTWTVLARKSVGHLKVVVNDIVRSMARVAKANNVGIDGLTMDMVGDVVEFTGPRRFKRSVMKSLKKSLNRKHGWNEYQKILEPKIAGDVLIFPGHAFAAKVNTYADEDLESLGPSLVTHHYSGSWKNKHGGETLDDDEEEEDEEDQDEDESEAEDDNEEEEEEEEDEYERREKDEDEKSQKLWSSNHHI